MKGRRLRLEAREEIGRRETEGSRPVMIAGEACRRWNGIPPAEHELADELTVAG